MTDAAPTEDNRFRISIFGKPDCALCKSAQRKVEFFLGKWQLGDRIELKFHDMSTLEGLTEGAYYDATDIPATLVVARGNVLARWDAVIPSSEELRRALTES